MTPFWTHRPWIGDPLGNDAGGPSSGQWCTLHWCHQDDPKHPYEYPECEAFLRNTTPSEEAAFLAQRAARDGADGPLADSEPIGDDAELEVERLREERDTMESIARDWKQIAEQLRKALERARDEIAPVANLPDHVESNPKSRTRTTYEILCAALNPEGKQCPTCGSESRSKTYDEQRKQFCPDPWHTSPDPEGEKCPKCPTCRSDDPKVRRWLGHHKHPERLTGQCPDSWHDQEGEK